MTVYCLEYCYRFDFADSFPFPCVNKINGVDKKGPEKLNLRNFDPIVVYHKHIDRVDLNLLDMEI